MAPSAPSRVRCTVRTDRWVCQPANAAPSYSTPTAIFISGCAGLRPSQRAIARQTKGESGPVGIPNLSGQGFHQALRFLLLRGRALAQHFLENVARAVGVAHI